MKKSKHRVLTYLLMLVMLAFALAGCKGKDKEADNTAVSATPAVTEAPVVTEAPTAVTEDSGNTGKDLTSLELVKLLGNGINLGNTMEAYGHKDLGTTADVSSYETLWGQPVTTKEMIESMKAAGFDTLRIPVAWTNAMNYESGDYTIGENYLNRVEEIINYALNADMYVIVNDHWDGSWWGMFGSATQETRDNAMKLYVSMWTQIANKYKEYSDHLIFESANEELGDRLNDKDVAADSGTLSEDECYAMANKINQTFVDTIRSTGGNNAERFLLIAGYNTDIAKTCDDRYVMPTDTAKDKLLLSVHYYTPWGYCGNSSLSSWGSGNNYKEQNDLLAKMTKFTEKGYGVVIGEYAVALKDDGSVKDNTVDFFDNFLNNCDMYGYCPVLWDCSSLFIRKDLGFSDKAVADFFKNRSYAAQSTMTEEDIAANAKAAIEAAVAAAAEKADTATAVSADKAIAWIMFNSNDWGIMYSVGNIYNPTDKTDGLVATDTEITGAGTYTVSLDFTGTAAGYADSTAFSALGIANGELLYPGYIINITDVQINGESYSLTGKPYTTSDNQICTRVNLFNTWVSAIPDDARTKDGNTSDVSAVIVDNSTLGKIKTLSITFDYGPAK
ncbi:MAG TPA: glycoside hydrolase family 5 protein [Mobilitalea sp.]|nr:glycoside hydrolase family 5 protein [Mobilitalea sp.]